MVKRLSNDARLIIESRESDEPESFHFKGSGRVALKFKISVRVISVKSQ